jgi:hypothetical protein
VIRGRLLRPARAFDTRSVSVDTNSVSTYGALHDEPSTFAAIERF